MISFVLAAALAATSPAQLIDDFVSAWAKVDTYTATITTHEVSGSRVQDRVYHLSYEKPHRVRMDIVQGDGRGGAAVWDGGDTVHGHQGGFLSVFRLTVNIHSRLATSIRGDTIPNAIAGAHAQRLQKMKTKSAVVELRGADEALVVEPADPAEYGGITKEVYVFGADHFPKLEEQWQGDTLVKRTLYTDLVINPKLPANTFSL